MPSLEIICCNQLIPLDYSALPFRVYAEDELVSHRHQASLFQSDFDALQGCIYHLCHQPNGAYTASGLLTEWWERLHFKDEFVPHLQAMLTELLSASPSKTLIFTSDYQFGPDVKRYKRPLTLAKFWEVHDVKKLRANALYIIHP